MSSASSHVTLGGASRSRRGERQRSPHMLGHGDLRLLLLGLLQSHPGHGYELIQRISGIFHGQYQPSAGAVYPALAQLQDDGLVDASVEGARRRHALTERGRGWVQEHADALAQARLRTEQSARTLIKASMPAPVRSGMAALKRALASHLGQWTPARAEAVAAILQRAATDIANMDKNT